MSTQINKVTFEKVDGMYQVVTEDVTEKALVSFDEAMASIPTIVGGVEQTAPRVTIEQIVKSGPSFVRKLRSFFSEA